jgi:hypothetical protein
LSKPPVIFYFSFLSLTSTIILIFYIGATHKCFFLFQGMRILCNYLPKFERIWTDDCKRPVMEPTCPDKWLGSLIFILSGGSHKWSLTIICPNSIKFGLIIVENPNPFSRCWEKYLMVKKGVRRCSNNWNNASFWIRILSNYLSEFERIRICDCEKPLMRPTWPDNWLGNLIFIWWDESYKWSLTSTCLNFLKFK